MTPLKRSNNLAARMGRWSAQHKKTAILGWLAFVVAAFAIGNAVGMKEIDFGTSAAGEAGRAQEILDDAGFGAANEQDEYVLVQSETATVADPAFRAAVEDAVRTVSGFGVVQDVESPLAPGNEGQVSADGRSALVTFSIAGEFDAAVDEIGPVVAAVAETQDRHDGFVVAEAGSASTGKAIDEIFAKDLEKAGILSLPLTLVILLVAFGAIVAAGIPLLLAVTAVAATMGLIALPSQLIPMDPSVMHVILLVGLAVGVDYSLFYLRREREERAAGKGPEAALEAAAATSGRAVLISGLTVMIAMAGMFFTGDAGFLSMGIATMMVVAVAVLGSLTVLPAVLASLGDRVEKGRIPFLGRRRRDGESRMWNTILDRVLARPKLSAAVSAGLLLALAAPVLTLHTAISGIDGFPRDTKELVAYHRIQEAFPGGPLPAIVAVQGDDLGSAEATAAFAELRERGLATGLMQDPITVDLSDDGTVARVFVPLAGNGTDETSNAALAALREDVLPATVGQIAETAVAGGTAESKDFNAQMKSSAPYVFGFVLSLAFLLLLVAFRSVVIAAKAIVLNLLSVGAAYGLLVLVFQRGWGEGILGFESTGGIASWLPIFLFVILFGLSMDYHVFILSRIREAYDRGLRTEDAVAHGIKTSAGVVTSAAVVMVAVFGIFATLSFTDMKQLGFGLAAAVLIDATIVRAVLLPAAMKLLGDWNWYLPRWLEWLPRLEHEAQAPRSIPAPAPAGR